MTEKKHSDDQTWSKPSGLRLRLSLWRQMLQDVAQRAPQEEACGLITGLIEGDYYMGNQVHPITNQLHSPTRYYMAPMEIISVFNDLDKKKDELIGIYHSHLNGPQDPSITDISQAYYPECVYLIWSHQEKEWTCRGYFIQGGQVIQVPLVIEE